MEDGYSLRAVPSIPPKIKGIRLPERPHSWEWESEYPFAILFAKRKHS